MGGWDLGDTNLSPPIRLSARPRRHPDPRPRREADLAVVDGGPDVGVVRQEGGNWLRSDVSGLDSVLAFATVPARVALADIYKGVTFEEENPS